jgi:hypothetical protein
MGPYMWIRNTEANHGNVFVSCRFKTRGSQETVLARAPTNGGKNYPYCEAVLIDSALSGIDPVGWGPIGGDTSSVHYWEYNSRDLETGRPVDVSRRHPASRQLAMNRDADLIADYRMPAYVLGGWIPKMAPLILSQPQSVAAKSGQTVRLRVEVAAIPEAGFQWFKGGNPIQGATTATLNIERVHASDSGDYTVMASNDCGTARSERVTLRVK